MLSKIQKMFKNAVILFMLIGVYANQAHASEEFYVPFPEDHTLSFLSSIASDALCVGFIGVGGGGTTGIGGDAGNSPEPDEPINTFTDFVARVDGTVIVIDHFEDGYETDIAGVAAGTATPDDPTTTRIYGDNNPANGILPGAGTDLLTAGQVAVFEESINTTTQLPDIEVIGQPITGGGTRVTDGLDGGDRVFATETINVTRAQWSGTYNSGAPATGQPGTLFAGGFELFPLAQWGTSFTLPAGEELGVNAFQWTGITIMAANDGTSVSVDANADGDFTDPDDVNGVVINRGETVEVAGRHDFGGQTTGGLNSGARIFTSDVVQTNVITGTECDNYQARWYTLFPDALLGSTYYEPVASPGANAGEPVATQPFPTVLYFYNPAPRTITINWETTAGLQTPIVISPNSSATQQMPLNTGARFFTGNIDTFGALTVIDHNFRGYDWGHATTSRRLMGNIIQVGFAEGDRPQVDDLYPGSGGIGQNTAPVWIIADNPNDASDTQYDVCVDVTGNGGPNTDPNTGRTYDYQIVANRLDSIRLYDGGEDTPNTTPAHLDGDQSGMLAFVCDGSDAILAAAWGQDPEVASFAAPAIDLGTTVRSVSNDVAFLGDTIYEDINDNGQRDAGENGIENVTVRLTPPPSVDLGNGPGQPIITTTDFNGSYLFAGLVDGDYTIEVIEPDMFRQTDDPDLANGDPLVLDSTATPTISNGSGRLDQDFGYVNEVPVGRVGDTIYEDTNGDGIQDVGENGISGIDVQLCYTTTSTTVLQLDMQPLGSTLASGYTEVTELDVGWSGATRASFNGNPAGDLNGDTVYHGDGTTTYAGVLTYSSAAVANGTYTINYGVGDSGNAFFAGPVDITIEGVLVNNDYFATGVDNLSTTITIADGQLDYQFQRGTGVSPSGFYFYNVNYIELVSPGSTVCQTMTTNGSGNYLFTGLAADFYTVTVLNPPAGTTNTDDPGSNADNTNSFTLYPSGGNLEQDFGYFTPATVSGHLYLDSNGNGVQDGVEPDLANVDVLITGSNGDLQTVTSDANGDYSATVPPGSTQVKVDESDPQYPTGFTQTEGTDPTTVTAVAGSNVSAGNDGYFQGGVIGDLIFFDTAGNPGIPNVTVTLTPPGGVDLGAGNGVAINTTTDSNGAYSFPGLPDGNYTVTVTQPGSTTQTVDPDGGNDNTSAVTISGANTNNLQDFGYTNNAPVGEIGDTIFTDTNGNGIQDGGELGIQSIVVQLCGDLDNNNGTANTCVTDTTDSSGNYLFTGVPATGAGEVYTVTVTNPPAGTVNTADPDGGLSDFSQLTLITGDLNQDFGYMVPAIVTGHLYIDSDGNGTQNGLEPDLVNVDVVITDSNGATQTVTTDINGDYSATVPLGTTTADVDETDPQFPVAHIQTEGTDPTVITAVAGVSTSIGIDGYSPNLPGTITGNVSEDTTGNGAGDTNLQGVTIQLYTDPNGDGDPSDGVLSATTTTNASGDYTFSTVSLGNYVLVEVDQAGFSSVSDIDTSGDSDNAANANTNDNLLPVTVGSSETDADNNFVDRRTASIAGRIWLDEDQDGINDIEETGLTPITVQLRTSGGALITEVASDENGNYIFPNLPPADYQITVDETTLPSALDNTAGQYGVETRNVTLLQSTNITDEDFGYIPTSGAVIGDKVWADADSDGVQDNGEVGIGDVTVMLIDPGSDGIVQTTTLAGGAQGDDTIVANTTTDSDGDYLFTNVTAGDYIVLVEAADAELTGYTPTSGPQSEGDYDSAPVSVSDGDVITDVDFGFDNAGLNTVSDTVWYDANGDGIKDVGEDGIPGVTVNLYEDADNNGTPDDNNGDGFPDVVGTAITDASGDVTFSGVTDGRYIVGVSDNDQELQGLNATTTAATAGITGSVDVDSSSGDSNPVNIDNDSFGYNNPGSISGTIWSDDDGDGVFEGFEPGIDSVTVELYEGATLIATVLSNADGSYEFDGLLPGNYQIRVTAPSGTQTGDPDLALDDLHDVTLGIGESIINRDFGYQDAANRYDISGTVFYDTDKDGVEELNGVDGAFGTADDEPGIPGVTLDLLLTDDVRLFNIINGQVDINNDGAIDASDDGVVQGVTIIDGGIDIDSSGTVAEADSGTIGSYNVIAGMVSLAQASTALATQSSDQAAFRTADRAIDGVTVGVDSGSYYAHTNGDTATDWWEVDLGSLQSIDSLVIFNRDNCCQDRLGNVHVLISDTPFPADPNDLAGALANADFSFQLPAVTTGDEAVNVGDISGRYIRLQRSGTNPGGNAINFAELKVVPSFIAASSPVIATTTTDANGNYSFTGLANGDYQVAVTDSDALLGGYDITSGLDTLPATINNANVADVDFGYVTEEATGSIAGEVFYDEDGDALAGASEPNFSGVTVNLYLDTDGDGAITGADTLVDTTTTDANGEYIFDNLPAGSYLVDSLEVDLPDAATIIDGQIDINGDGVIDINDNGEHFGIAVIGGQFDTDNDGDIDTDDDGATPAGVNIIDGLLDISGNGSVDGSDDGVSTSLTETTSSPLLVNLAEAEISIDNDIGYEAAAGTVALSGTTWIDADNDGVFDNGEIGLGGILIELRNVNLSNHIFDVIRTNPDGTYFFTGLTPADDYEVQYSANPADFPTGLDSSQPTNLPPGDTRYVNIDLPTAGDEQNGLDFGFAGPGGTPPVTEIGSIAGTIYRDNNSNSVYELATDGEYNNVTLNLSVAPYTVIDGSIDMNNDGVINSSDDGNYLGLDVIDGRFDVDGDGDVDSDDDGAINGVTIIDGGLDIVVNGTVDSADDGTLSSLVIASTTTDADGNYSFVGLPFADYVVSITDHNDSLQNVNPTQVLPARITVDGVEADIDAGFASDARLGSVGNFVWLDEDDDGIFDEGEQGIAGVTIQCWYDADDNTTATGTATPVPGLDNLIRSVTTDANGEYYCTSLPTGKYIVVVVDDDEILADYDPSAVIHSGAPENDMDNHAKTEPYVVQTASPNLKADFARSVNATISGTVYEDTDASGGDQGSGEAGIGGVTVQACRVDGSGQVTGNCRTIVTDSSGNYTIPVGVGNWRVSVLTSNPLTGLTATTAISEDVVTVNGSNIQDVDFGYQSPPITTNPVTLTYFLAQTSANKDEVLFTWETGLEVATIGFDIYVRGAEEWEKVNPKLITSKVFNSFEATEYEFRAYGVEGQWFALVDVDASENVTVRGPFKRDQEYGVVAEDIEVFDWSQVKTKPTNKVDSNVINQRLQDLLNEPYSDEPDLDSDEADSEEPVEHQ